MAGVPIGTLARATGLTPSSIRYYESAGLLPKPARQSGQRRYGPEATARLKIIHLARDAGFTIAETLEAARSNILRHFGFDLGPSNPHHAAAMASAPAGS
jgi:DNA-binding transcriptional MerR regulator